MSALGGIYTALKTLIANDATVAGLIANAPFAGAGGSPNAKAVYDDGTVPQGATYPLVTVGAGASVEASSLRTVGWNCTVQVKPIAQSTATVQAIVAAISAALRPGGNPVELTVTGFPVCRVAEISEVPQLIELIAGATVKSVPMIVRVYA